MTTTDRAILLVDDEAAVCHVFALVLKREGYRVLEAGSGREALALYRQHAEAIRLIITDVEMPNMRGPELAAELAKMGCSAPVLYISAFHTEGPLLAAGIHFLRKPFTPSVLVETVKQLAGPGNDVEKKQPGSAAEARPGSQSPRVRADQDS